jgi:hypothetical protein
MTLAEFKTAIEWEGKIQNNTEAIAQLGSIIDDAIIFLAQTHPELLVTSSDEYDLETDNPTVYTEALGVDKVQIQTGDGEPYDIPNEDQVVGPAPFPSWPKYYCIEGNANNSAASPKGIRVNLKPGLSDPNGEIFIVTWKKIPTLISGADLVPAAWIPFLKKEVLSRLTLQRSKAELDIVKAHKGDATQAIQAHMSTDSESVAASN